MNEISEKDIYIVVTNQECCYYVFLFKKISRQDAIDTINAVKKFMKKTDDGIEATLRYLRNPN